MQSASGLLTEAKARKVADNAARERGITLGNYEEPHVDKNSDDSGYYVFYHLKPPGMPGGHFTVRVDRDGKATLFGGE